MLDPARQPSPLAGISRNVFLLGLVSLLTDISSEMLYPLTPLFLTSVLKAPVSTIGWIEGIAEATASLLKGLSGWLSDRYRRRRPFVIAGYSLSALAKPLLALAASPIGVLAARLVDRFGKGVRSTSRDALLADSSLPEARGRAFGFHRSADQTGAVIGPLLSLPLLAAFDHDFRKVFLFAFLPAIAGAALLFLVREPQRPVLVQPSSSGPGPKPAASPGYRRLLIVMTLFALANSSDTFLLLRARSLGATPETVVLLFALFNLTTVLAAWPGGRLSDRLGRKPLLIAALVLFAAVYLGFAMAPAQLFCWPLFAIYGLYAGLGDSLVKAFALDQAPQSGRGATLGLLATVQGIATLPASAWTGYVWQYYSPESAFLVTAATAAVCAVLLALWVPRPATREGIPANS